MHFYAWKKGLKTGMYYLRTKAATDAIKFTVDQTALAAKAKKDGEAKENDAPTPTPAGPPEPEECLACGA